MAIFGAICLTVIFWVLLIWITTQALNFFIIVADDGFCFETALNIVGILYILVALSGWGFIFAVITKTFLRMST